MSSDRATCLHFSIRSEDGRRCAAGVDVEQLRDPDQRLPCHLINGITGAVNCDQRELPDSPEHRPGRASALLELALADRCTFCGAELASTREVGGRIYALPCEHVIRTVQPRRSA